MKKLLTTICAGTVLSLMVSCGDTSGKAKTYNQGINIIPAPVSLTQNEGNFKLSENTKIYVSTPEARTIAEFFVAEMNTATGYQMATADKETSDGISLVIDGSLDVNSEGYALDATDSDVRIKAKTPQGLFYGIQSFLQLLPAEVESPSAVKGIAWTAPAVSIKDEPRFGYRGIMLDPCRHFIPVENIKRRLDVLALFKINRMCWHLTDDQGWCIEIKKYPKLTKIDSERIDGEGTKYGGFYTQEKVEDIVKYAADRFITIVPEIELPGHKMAAIAAYPELSYENKQGTPHIIWGVEDIILYTGKEEPFQFLEDVVAEIAPLFPDEYFHIGGNERPKTGWEKCPLCRTRIRKEDLKDDKEHTAEERLQNYFIQRMEKVVDKHGKKMVGWDEVLEGSLAPSATVMSWQDEKGGIVAASISHDVIMTPGSEGMYIDQFQGDYKINPVSIRGFTVAGRVYKCNPIPDTLAAAGKGHFIKGVQCNVWSEYLYNTDIVEYRIYPRILALSEIAWNPLDQKDYKDSERRLDSAQVRLDGHGISYYIPQPGQPSGSCSFVVFTDKATMTFTTNRPMRVVCTLDGTEPTSESTVYTAPFDITETTTVKIASVLPPDKIGKSRTILVEKQTLAPAKKVAKTTSGLGTEVFDGMYLDVNNLEAAQKTGKEQVIKTTRELTNQVPAPESIRGVKQYTAIATGYVNIPENGVYHISSDSEEVWIDGKLIVNNGGEIKRFSRHGASAALAKDLHEIRLVFLGHTIGGWPSNRNDGSVQLRRSDAEEFTPITAEMLNR